MKTVLTLFGVIVLTVACHGQGEVTFITRAFPLVDAPVSIGSPNGPGPGPAWSAGLWLVNADASLLPLPGSFTTFREIPPGGNPLLAKYIVTVPYVIIPGTPMGHTATLRMRAWRTSAGSYDNATAFDPEGVALRAESSDFVVYAYGGLGGPGITDTVQGFIIPVIPEPCAAVIGALGATALLLAHCRRQPAHLNLIVLPATAPLPIAAAECLVDSGSLTFP